MRQIMIKKVRHRRVSHLPSTVLQRKRKVSLMIKRTLFACGMLLLFALFLFPSSRAFAASHQMNMPLSNFTATCTGISITGSGIMTASCRKANGQSNTTALDLNTHVGNNNGTLVAGDSNFKASCRNIGGTSILRASCRRGDGTYNSTALDMNPYINNSNGSLVWG